MAKVKDSGGRVLLEIHGPEYFSRLGKKSWSKDPRNKKRGKRSKIKSIN